MLSVSRPRGQSAFRATCSRSGGLWGHLLSCLLLSGHLLSEQRALEVACPRCGGLAGCAFLAACSQGTVFSGLRFISRQRAHGAACFRCSVFGAACSWGSVLSERRALGAAPALGAACCQRRVLAVPRAIGAPRRWIAAVDSATGCGRVGFSVSVGRTIFFDGFCTAHSSVGRARGGASGAIAASLRRAAHAARGRRRAGVPRLRQTAPTTSTSQRTQRQLPWQTLMAKQALAD